MFMMTGKARWTADDGDACPTGSINWDNWEQSPFTTNSDKHIAVYGYANFLI